MGQKLDNARGLYLEGIHQGKAKEALDKYIGDRYTQHSTGVADGKEGFLEFFLPFLERNPVRDIRIVRAIEDGPYVFVQAHQSLNNGQFYYVTGDFFDTNENDKIVEHWDAIQEEVKETKSGRSMVDGATKVEDLDKTEENRQLLQGFFDTVLVGGQYDRITDYISTETYWQHNPAVGDGIEGFQVFAGELQAQGIQMNYIKVHKLLVQGNFAASLSHVKMNEEDWCIVDIFRVKDGKIVEHWDVMEKIGPEETWNNSGKF
ncbi:MAG: nuclear transport factor 2 family protein [Bacteroidota bacterium]